MAAKKIACTLVDTNGNAFALMGKFAGCAREQGWTEAEIEAVVREATSGDYNHLLRTLAAHCTNGGLPADGEEDE